MDVYYSRQGLLKEKYNQIYLGLGNFDGIHIGHQKLISDLVDVARQRGGVPAVMTFYPHPLAVLQPAEAPLMLLSQTNKQEFMEGLGVEVLLVMPFDRDFACLAPDTFIKDILYGELGVKGVFVGYNYTFGCRGLGTPDLLKSYGGTYGFDVHVVPPVCVGEQVVNSTLIRGLIEKGEVGNAAKFLGYVPFIQGEVVYGERRGNTLGFPTANLELDSDLVVPDNGVYAVHVELGGCKYPAVANIGTKPTFHGFAGARCLEVHLLDFSADLYGQTIKVSFIRRLRGEKRFNSVGELVAQIKTDIGEARICVVD
ncbi:riboflavin biosynthesis protein RibF [Desulfofarcimen acetoxidans DSM 771]|uniref:Riboflavin biosynthesis protein n=1 Tax=Desulfofarcimen acetoxidans (strain ATCC 49208 / DSM 771 / KCTC 5769 / VKM B-1644 / 5575) TaxID=485916 RepID=C8W4P0_DESAS|nr:bifunctional riboflavin kinase/FAD synthetase [Desulfofarcimen acetoxidans]ACV63926.1 riboflavin biosynthesis protein RibF [Desulfofarcimen acetoxidans DSM 771]